MKKYTLYLLLAALVGLTASCSKVAEESDLQTADNSTVRIGASIDTGVSTRSGGDSYTIPDNYKLRYILEVWSTGDGAAVVYREEQEATDLTGVKFTFKLEKTGNYQALLWADFIDKNSSASPEPSGPVSYDHYTDKYYTTTNGLKQIALKLFSHSKEAADAFFGCVDIKKEAGAYNSPVTLNRPFGQVNIIEKNGTLAEKVNAVKITYNAPRTFDVSTGTPGAVEKCGSDVHFDRPTPSGDRKANLAYIYVFAPNEGQTLLGEITMGFSLMQEVSQSGISFPSFTIPANMPVERNKRTNISGSILKENSDAATLSVSLSTDWSTEVEEKDIDLKVGDYYYKNGTWSPDLNPTMDNPIIGVIFKVNDDGKTGSVVSLNEPTGLAWAVDGHQNKTGANDWSDGKGNTDKVLAYINDNGEDIANYPIFNACQTQRTKTGNNGWYIPIGYSDLTRVAELVEQINAKITAAGGIKFVVPAGGTGYYWTSREATTSTDASILSSATSTISTGKGYECKVRFFLDF